MESCQIEPTFKFLSLPPQFWKPGYAPNTTWIRHQSSLMDFIHAAASLVLKQGSRGRTQLWVLAKFEAQALVRNFSALATQALLDSKNSPGLNRD